jgi:hypothetical protein
MWPKSGRPACFVTFVPPGLGTALHGRQVRSSSSTITPGSAASTYIVR